MSIRAIVLLALLWCCMGTTHAQEINNSCTGYIDALPATIVKPGTWCLRRDLVAPAGGFDLRTNPGGSGGTLTVLANDTTLDCRGFRIRGTVPGGGPRQSVAIVASNRSNVTVRGCKVRGFWAGILLLGGRGLVAQDNLVEDSAYLGISMRGRASTLRRNAVVRTGGATDVGVTIGIDASEGVEVSDNLVADLSPPRQKDIEGGSRVAIFTYLNAASVSRNRVRQETTFAHSNLYGVLATNESGKRAIVRHNDLIGPGGTAGVGVLCVSSATLVADNVVNGFATGVGASCASQGNYLIE